MNCPPLAPEQVWLVPFSAGLTQKCTIVLLDEDKVLVRIGESTTVWLTRKIFQRGKRRPKLASEDERARCRHIIAHKQVDTLEERRSASQLIEDHPPRGTQRVTDNMRLAYEMHVDRQMPVRAVAAHFGRSPACVGAWIRTYREYARDQKNLEALRRVG